MYKFIANLHLPWSNQKVFIIVRKLLEEMLYILTELITVICKQSMFKNELLSTLCIIYVAKNMLM